MRRVARMDRTTAIAVTTPRVPEGIASIGPGPCSRASPPSGLLTTARNILDINGARRVPRLQRFDRLTAVAIEFNLHGRV